MKRISAHYIFSPDGSFLKNGILITKNNGEIIELIDTSGDIKELEKMEFHSGILVPGVSSDHISMDALSLFHPYESLLNLNASSTESIFLFLKKIQQLLPKVELNHLLQTFIPTSQRFSAGNRPDIYLIGGADLKKIRLTEKSTLKKLQ